MTTLLTHIKTTISFLSSFLFCLLLLAQTTDDRPDIFIDCQMYCDFTYIKQEIRFVNFLQNRQDADVYVLATRQSTGAGGREIQLSFNGNNEFAAINDTIIYFTDPNSTEAIQREQFVQEIKRGLLQFLVQTPLINKITYEVEPPDEDEIDIVIDPWKNWVFNIGGNGRMDGEASNSGISLSGRFNATNINDDHKLRVSSFYNYNKSTFKLTEGNESFIFKSYNARVLYVKSLGPNWSAGFESRVGSSTFGNTDVSATFRPAIEYNIYPYTEASLRRFSFNYSIGPEYYNYTDSTIYNLLEETRFRHGIDIEYSQTEKWGSVSLDIGLKQYLHNLKQYNAYFNPNIEWQIFKGFSIDIGGYVSFVTDRINIAKADISDEDILLQIRQLDTDFAYFTYFGINYRFGSKYNNFVNPRF